MPYCPNCGDEIAADARSCPSCDALFAQGAAWRPVTEPPAHRDVARIAELRLQTEQRREREHQAQAALVEREPLRTPDRPPTFGALSLILPLAGWLVLLLYGHATESRGSSGGWGIGEVFLGTLIVSSGIVLGAIAVVVAILRREGWVVLQVIGGIGNFGALLLLGMVFVL
jgi:hypothetical protein